MSLDHSPFTRVIGEESTAAQSTATLNTGTTSSDGSEQVRSLAAAGALADEAAKSAEHRTAMSSAVYALAWPVVFSGLTRRIELRNGHYRCAQGVEKLAPECLDRFEDAVEAVVDDALQHANRPIHNLEAWMASRLNAATVNAHRRLRGSRGALQRPRAPRWLIGVLGADPWLVDLAVQILIWTGVPVVAGNELWPLDAWAQRRASITGDWTGSDPARVRRDIGVVLAAMRQRSAWYDEYVERPLGHKQAPTVSDGHAGDDGPPPPPLPLTQPHEIDEARLAALAEEALAALRTRLARGEDARSAVGAVIGTVFGGGGVETTEREIGCAPLEGPSHGEVVTRLLSDPAEIDRITARVLAVVEHSDATDANRSGNANGSGS